MHSFSSSFKQKPLQQTKELNVIVKTNFAMSGRLQKDGTRATQKSISSHSASILDYIDNHGNEDLEKTQELSNLYNSEGDRLLKEEVKELKKEQIQAFRRILISPKEPLSREEMKELTTKTMQEFSERVGKDLRFSFAIHTNTEHIHSHVLIVGTNRDINFTKEQLSTFKDIASNQTKEIQNQKELTLDKELSHTKELNKEVEL